MSELATIARPYAKAAFDLAVEKGKIAQWSEMLFFAAEVARNETILDFIGGMHSAEKLTEMFLSVCGEQLNKLGQNLIKVMAENGRLQVLPEVYVQFMIFRHEYEKQIDVDVISAVVLKKGQRDAIAKKLKIRFERNVKLNCSVDETLLGGVVIRAGDLLIDHSISGSVRRLSNALQS